MPVEVGVTSHRTSWRVPFPSRRGTIMAMAALSNDDYRRILGQPDLTDEEVEEIRVSLRRFISVFLDDYFREEFQTDEEWDAGTRTLKQEN